MSLQSELSTNPVYMPLSQLPEYQVSEILKWVAENNVDNMVIGNETYIKRSDYHFYLEKTKEGCLTCK